jgi:hypothetical protein
VLCAMANTFPVARSTPQCEQLRCTGTPLPDSYYSEGMSDLE